MELDLNFNAEPTSADLIRQHGELAAEMSEAINDGDIEQMVRIDAQVKSLAPRIFATQLAELKANIEANESRKAEVEKEMETLRQIRADRNRKLARAILLQEKRGEAVVRADFALQVAQTELESIRVSRRELRAKLDTLKQAKLKQQEKENEEFRNTIYAIGN